MSATRKSTTSVTRESDRAMCRGNNTVASSLCWRQGPTLKQLRTFAAPQQGSLASPTPIPTARGLSRGDLAPICPASPSLCVAGRVHSCSAPPGADVDSRDATRSRHPPRPLRDHRPARRGRHGRGVNELGAGDRTRTCTPLREGDLEYETKGRWIKVYLIRRPFPFPRSTRSTLQRTQQIGLAPRPRPRGPRLTARSSRVGTKNRRLWCRSPSSPDRRGSTGPPSRSSRSYRRPSSSNTGRSQPCFR
jgi:hypothetical protein